jgi:hypothetical protein
MPKISIIHFSPLELYPPVMNWLNFISVQPGIEKYQITVYTSKPQHVKEQFVPGNASIKIKRIASFSGNSISRYLNYVKFYFLTLLGLIFNRPGTVLYYETLSAIPAVLYKKWFNRKSRLFIHYHEYTSGNEYIQGMIINRWGYRLEKSIFNQCEWISHTNNDRLRKFLQDNPEITTTNTFELPNNPPVSWIKQEQKNIIQLPVKMVYVGALSLNTMYIQELCDWVKKQEGKVILDIYSSNYAAGVTEYLDALDKSMIRFYGGVNYFSLPLVLASYDIGVIIYKGHIENYIYNAPNKLFEYLACGLDVWFPDLMKSSWHYVTKGLYPKVIPVNFNALDQINLDSIIDRSDLQFHASSYRCEDVLLRLWNKIENNAATEGR